MDIATIIGLLLGIGLVSGSILMDGGGMGPFINVPSMMIVIGGSIAALLINFPLARVLSVFKVVKNCFFVKLPSEQQVIDQFKDLADVVRKDGILALEGRLDEIRDPFMRRGLEMIISGSPKDDIQEVLETEMSYIEQRHATGKKIIESLAAAAPAFGMIGTLIGLVQMLRTLDDPSKIGGGMATALLTTLYGALIANLFCIPLAGKLEARSGQEMTIRDLMISGMTSIVDGQSPRVLEERLLAFVSAASRTKVQATAA